MEDCMFCKIIRGEVPADWVLEDPGHVAFWDIDPIAPVHILVMPRYHVSTLNYLESQTQGDGAGLVDFVVRVAETMGIKDSGYRVLINVGPDARQVVHHLHVHVLGGADLGEMH